MINDDTITVLPAPSTGQGRAYGASSQHGFTLIELSVVLVIISLIAAAFLNMGIKQTDVSKVELTNTRLDRIEDALGQFLLETGHLPCPAEGGAKFNERAYGVADDAACGNTLIDEHAIHVGTVPVITLGLADEYMLDAWNRRFTYVVDAGFITREGFEQALPIEEPDVAKQGSIMVLSRDDDIAGPPERTNSDEGVGAVMVLISHGPNGHGAWPKGGGTARLNLKSVDEAEIENAHATGDMYSIDNQFTQTDRTGTFDDIVRYRLRWQAIMLAGGIVDPATCQMVWRANNNTSDVASPKLGSVGCFNEEYELNPLCTVRQRDLARTLLQLCFVRDPKAP